MKSIRESKSRHSSPAFMIRKHNEIKRGKATIVINYKEVNKNTKFDGYYISNKEILINLARGKNYYIKFDYKSGFWQIKIVRPEKFQFLEKWQNRNFRYKIVISGKNLKFILWISDD